MATNPAVPFWDEADITVQASAAITGKRFVSVSGPRVGEQVQAAPTAAAARPLGVAAFDAAVGQLVTVYGTPGDVLPVTAAAAIAAGADVEVAAGGMVTTLAAGTRCGTVLDDVAAGADAMVKLA